MLADAPAPLIDFAALLYSIQPMCQQQRVHAGISTMLEWPQNDCSTWKASPDAPSSAADTQTSTAAGSARAFAGVPLYSWLAASTPARTPANKAYSKHVVFHVSQPTVNAPRCRLPHIACVPYRGYEARRSPTPTETAISPAVAVRSRRLALRHRASQVTSIAATAAAYSQYVRPPTACLSLLLPAAVQPLLSQLRGCHSDVPWLPPPLKPQLPADHLLLLLPLKGLQVRIDQRLLPPLP